MTTGMMAHILRPQSIFSKPTVLGTMGEQKLSKAQPAAFNITYSFINTTIWDIVITDHLNASWEVNSTPSTMDDGFVEIRKQYDVRDHRVSLLNIGLECGDKSETLSDLVNHFKRSGDGNRYNITKDSIILSYKVYARDLQKNPSIDLAEIGFLVTRRTEINKGLPINPMTRLGKEVYEAMCEHDRGFVFKVDIVDPHGELGEMYINIGSVVSKVRVRQALNFEDNGIYVSRSVQPSLDNPSGYVRSRFDLADYAKVPLFPSAALAMAHGDVLARLKEEHEVNIQKLKHESDQAKLETEKVKLHNAERLQVLEGEVKSEQAKQAKLKTKLDDLKMQKEKELMAVKHEMEMRSLDRKDSSEILKWIPALVVSAGAIMVALKK